ncbi:MAG: family 10 glycosylhydrolase [bacterium]|nr:family 10 glycosylhydrolase [bacterium]
MKKNFLLTLSVVALLLCLTSPASALKHEQRAVWMSGFINDWPSGPISTSNAETAKKGCRNAIDSLARNNYTTIYYHVRAMCDAMYDSKYEPWSSYVSSGGRGVAPVFDPFAYIIEQAHSKGLEVYAWINPYRYINSTSKTGWGDAGGDLNYENSHPDWLLKWTTTERTWTILNPALPEVKQRIVDIVADIMDKYDIDGVVFDDYFYQNGVPNDLDATQYNAYKASAGTAAMSQGDWRRENINDMVRRVNNYIKSTKPWVRFGIGPAGVACSNSTVAAKYGVEPAPGSDWQYNGIFSDPMAWISEGSIDFISPQIYWPIGYDAADFAAIAPWWYKVCAKYNRHCFVSQDLASNLLNGQNLEEFYNEIAITHNSVSGSTPGTVYFPWKSLRDFQRRVNGKNVTLMNYLRNSLFDTRSFTPAVLWLNAECPGLASSVKRSSRTLSWSGPDNVRYAIYAVPKTLDKKAFAKDAQYLLGISYSKSYDIPAYEVKYPKYGIADADLDNYNYAVAVLDRYGNEWAATFEGATLGKSQKPTLTFPLNGELAPMGFQFQWTGTAAVTEITLATDAEFKNIISRLEAGGNAAYSGEFYNFQPNVTYYWRATARDHNCSDATSTEVGSFQVDVFRMISPAAGAAEVSLTPTLECSNVGAGATYTFLIDTSNSFSSAQTFESTTPTFTMPKYKLAANTTYYVMAQAKVGDAVESSDAVQFTTKHIEVSAPQIVTPEADGVTLHADEKVVVAPMEGIIYTRIGISASTSFPARSSYNGTFSAGEFATPQLSDVKLVSSYLTDGKTYYVRAQYEYRGVDGKLVTTDWTTPRSFVYSAEAGVASINANGFYVVCGNNAKVVAGNEGLTVEVFATDGKLVMTTITSANGEASLAALASGSYLVKVAGKTAKLVK